jgi:hypothetical protein
MQDDDSLLQSFVTIKPAPKRFFPTEQMLTEQLNTGAQEPKVFNIYRNYLSTTQIHLVRNI